MTEDVAKKRRDNIRLTVIGVLLMAAAGVAGFVHKVIQPRVLSFNELRENGAIVFEKPRIFGKVDLIDQDGNPFDSVRLEGKWTIMLFGFTFCPDICPTALADLNRMVSSNGENPLSAEELADLQIVMVSVDPERDTPEVLNNYVKFFNEDFVGVTGNPHFIRKLAAELNIAYNKVPMEGEGEYTVDHSGNLVIINPRGHYHGFFRHPQDSMQMRYTWRSMRASFKG